jgi:4'-phosphopantetheinyl transferase EntD
MIEEILPPWVATATFKGDDPAGWLWPAEAALVERAVESRVREFTTGRMCARKALAQLGAETGPILSGDQREALWPMGVTGSITHCRGYRAAAVAWQKQVLGIGIDAELDSVLPDGLLDLVASEQERAWMARQPGPEPWDRLLFSAKEAGLLRGRYLRRDGLILTALLVPLDCSGWVRRVQSSADPV